VSSGGCGFVDLFKAEAATPIPTTLTSKAQVPISGASVITPRLVSNTQIPSYFILFNSYFYLMVVVI